MNTVKNQILVMYGDSPRDMVKELLARSGLTDGINTSGLIGIKPNLVVAKPSASGATTSPELVRGVIEHLQELGYRRIVIMEGSWLGESTANAFKVCGYEKMSREYGVALVDLKKDGYREVDAAGLKLKICRQSLEVDYLINMPVLKAHCQTRLTCALKNLKGCIPDSEKRRFHSLGLHEPIAHLNKALRSDLIIVDGMCGDLTFEEGGSPVRMNRIMAGTDPVLMDAYAAELIGYETRSIPYIGLAAGLGVGSLDTNNARIIELNAGDASPDIARSLPSSPSNIKRLTRFVEERNACSACYGSLLHALKRLEEENKLNGLRGRKIFVGQGFKGKSMDGLGIGTCTRQFNRSLPGCPPNARAIATFLLEQM